MPLVRVEVRNEYALGAPELWREANKEDPKELLEGVAVAGLVGVLRQLGDLAEFAAEVFHGLQEEVSVTFSRSHKLMARVKRIEAALPPLEKAVLAQRSHLHFAYTAGSNWHTRIRCQQNHFVYSDVPDFIMDSYEDSRDPPRLHLLDRFDPAGPGSCLRRYSDPTFFKRASGAYAEANTGKTSKDKKSRKIKKRSSWSRYGGASRGTSFSYHSGRARFSERSIGEHTSPSQTIFTDEPTLRSEWGEESNLDMRNRTSGYTGGDFCPSYSTQQELESRVSFSSSIKRRDSDFLDYNFIEGKITDPCDVNHVNQSLEQAGCGTSSVMGDEKPETLEPEIQDCDPYILQNNLDQESLPQIFETGATDNTVVILENSDIQKVDVGTASVPENCDWGTIDTVNVETADVHLEDVESETDDFEDALNNIIESEPETDTAFVRKQVEHYNKLEDKAKHGAGKTELIRRDPGPSKSESNFQANSSLVNGNFDYHNPSVTSLPSVVAFGSINKTEDNSDLNAVNLVNEALLSAQRNRELSFDSHENNHIDDGPIKESVPPTGSFNFTGAMSEKPILDGTRSSPDFPKVIPERPIIDGTRSGPDFPKSGPETVNVASSTIWTNGGLLGLQPSKPPDLSGSNAHSQDNVTKKDDITRKPHETENHEIEEDCQESVALFRKPTWKLSPADLDVKLGKLGDSRYPQTTRFTGARVMAPGSVPANSTFQTVRKNEESCSSSRMLELSNRLLSTGSNKELLPCENGNDDALKNLENNAYQKIFGRTKDLLGVDCMMDSPSSSPPLQHMKILLQPIDGFETSKLKMKFSDGNPNNGSGRDIFPSFQLVPEASITRRDIGSDSDDDTFCRSSPISDDCESHHSASNSEIWESGESARSKDHELYDALQRISLTESVSTLPENGNSIHGLQFPVENSINSQSHRSYDIQSLDTLNHSFRDDLKIYTNLMNVGDPQTEPSPAPPPLPPVQWRGVDSIEETYGVKHGGHNYTFDEHLESTISQQPKPAPFNHDQAFETTKMQKSKTFSSWKSNGQRDANQGKGMEEKEDFLQQIRTKSFHLRPIASAKMMTPSGGSTNVQVTAILEKANAIRRQAIGSDDGEDDSNWSDT